MSELSSNFSETPRSGYENGALHVRADEGPVKWVAGDEYTIKVSTKDTDGTLGFVVATVPPGNGPIAHLHQHSDESFFILEGELEFLNGDDTFMAREGDFVFVPRGIRHRFRNVGTEDVKMAFFFTPGGPENFFLDFGDEPLPGHAPQLWTPERFTPQMIEANIQMGNIVLPEDN
ncbi:cupin domain-containing protein [Streptomyces sp. NBC_01341]|uniref:cupin domain-containing protein n=1 Tax=Streptomyces sp. NBC_01341 TaxID=2903831 RepID=UPI002E119FBD|nr:cupin domain-containing protein [Streptomyces sp. NBC_01341]